jgi:glyoxylase-like metal-dependent hydrolase (beta-lactamase superfamily II)
VSGWFYTHEPVHGIWLVGEPQHVYCWLVEGDERAVILDTGLGVEPIRPVAEAVARRPVSVVNTHYHFDHVGGNHEFDDIAIHQLGADLINSEVPAEVLAGYVAYAERQLGAAEVFRSLDREFFWLLTAESDPRPFPEDFDPAAWTIRPSRATTTLTEGDRIDLGGRTLTVLHTPGHSPDGISLFEEREGLLFVGDAFNAGPIYAHFADSNLDALQETARRFSELAEDVSLVFAHHYGRPLADSRVFHEFEAAVAQLRSGSAVLSDARDVLDSPMREARFDHFSITVPGPKTRTTPLAREVAMT